jgi:hypothetical protein
LANDDEVCVPRLSSILLAVPPTFILWHYIATRTASPSSLCNAIVWTQEKYQEITKNKNENKKQS